MSQFEVDIDNVIFEFEKDGGSFFYDNTAKASYTQQGLLEAVENAVIAYKLHVGE